MSVTVYPDESPGIRSPLPGRSAASLLGNLVWLVFGGLLTSAIYLLGGIVLCCTLVGIPFGLAAMRLGVANLAPFGKRVRVAAAGDSALRLVFNALWFISFGWGVAVSHLVAAVFLAATVVGIPWALQHLKLIPLALLPFGRRFD